jgi:hypothetical protein
MLGIGSCRCVKNKTNKLTERGLPLILVRRFFVPVQPDDEFSGHTQPKKPSSLARTRSPAPGNNIKAWQLVFRRSQGELCHWPAGGRRCTGNTPSRRPMCHAFISKFVLRNRIHFSAYKRASRGCDVEAWLAYSQNFSNHFLAFCGEPSRVPRSPRHRKISPPLVSSALPEGNQVLCRFLSRGVGSRPPRLHHVGVRDVFLELWK